MTMFLEMKKIKKYYRDNQSDIYIVKYKEGEPSAELYILWHGEEKFFGTIPNIEDEDFKLGLAGETIGIELDEYHYC